MDIPVTTYDVTLGPTLVGTFTNEVYAAKAVEFIGQALKAGAIFQPKDADLKYLPVARTAPFESVAAAEAAGLTVDYDTIIAQLAAITPAPAAPAAPTGAPVP